MDINYLNTLLNTHSVSGFENQAGKLFLDYIISHRMLTQLILTLWVIAMHILVMNV